MSRFEITSPDNVYTFAYGVDHVTSVFFTVYKNNREPDERVVLSADNLGLMVDEVATFSANQTNVIQQLTRAFDMARARGIPHPNISVDWICAVGWAFNIPLNKAEVYRNLD